MSDQSQTNGAAPPASAEQPQEPATAEPARDRRAPSTTRCSTTRRRPGEPGQLDDGGQPQVMLRGRFAPKDAKPGEQSTDPALRKILKRPVTRSRLIQPHAMGVAISHRSTGLSRTVKLWRSYRQRGRPSSSGGTPRWSGTTRRRRRRRRQQSSSRSRWHRSSRTRSWSGRCSRPGSLRSKRSVSGQGSTAGPWTPTFRSGSSCTRSSASAWVWTQRQAAKSRSGPAGQLSEEDLKDPAIRFFADNIGKTLSDVAALRGQFEQMQRSAAEAQATR